MNKFFGKKGQGAMEYLMTYGWAILVVMIVGVVLWQLGIFNLGGTVSKTMSGFGALRPVDWSMSTAGNEQIVLINGEGTNVNIKTVALDSDDGTCEQAAVAPTQTPVNPVSAGDSVSVSGGWCTPGAAYAGKSYKIIATISYNKTIGGVTQDHSSVGTFRGVWE